MKSLNLFLCFIIFLIWSTSSTLLAEILENSDPIFLSSIVIIISFLLLQIIILSGSESRQALGGYSLKELSKLLLPAILGIFLYPIAYFYGISGTSPLKANVINYLWPLIAFVSSFFLTKSLPNLWQCGAMLSAAIGGYIVMVGNSETWDLFCSREETFALIGAFLGALSYGFYTAIITYLLPHNKNGKPMPDKIRLYYMVFIAFLLQLVFSPVYFYYRTEVCISSIVSIVCSQKVFFYVLLYSIINFTIAHFLWNIVNSSNDKNITIYASSMAYLIPFASTICLACSLKQDIDFTVSIGLLLIVLSIIVMHKNNINSVSITFIAFMVTSLLLGITPRVVDKSIVESAAFYLEIIIAIYSIIYGFLMNRVIRDFKNCEELLNNVSIKKLLLSKDEKLIALNYEKSIMNKEQHVNMTLVMTDSQLKELFIKNPNLLFGYLSIIRNKNQAISYGEWFVIIILSLSVIGLSFCLKDSSLINSFMTVVICTTTSLSFGTLYEYTHKKKRLLRKH